MGKNRDTGRLRNAGVLRLTRRHDITISTTTSWQFVFFFRVLRYEYVLLAARASAITFGVSSAMTRACETAS